MRDPDDSPPNPADAAGVSKPLADRAGRARGAGAHPAASVLNLTNNILGAGLFTMPWCLRQTTVSSGVALLVFVAIANTFSFVTLSRCCDLSGEFSFLQIGRVALGPRFGRLVQWVVALYTIGSCSVSGTQYCQR